MSRRSIEESRCVLCETRITTDSRSATDTPGPFHRECWGRVSRVTLALTRLIRATAPGGLCHACLAARLAIDERVARTAAWRLRSNPEFRVGLGPCTGCGLRRMTTRARPAAATLPRAARAGETERIFTAFSIDVADRVCLALAGPGVLAPSALAEVTSVFLARQARRVYLVDFDGVALDAAMRSDPRVVIVAPLTTVAELRGLPERPSVAAIDLRFGTVKESLPALLQLLDRRGEAVVRVRVHSLVRLSGEGHRTYWGVASRVAIVAAARAASLGGWHVAGVAPVSRVRSAAPAFFLHLTTERREEKELDAMIAQTVEALA
jgi:hypothetical protein